MAVFDERDATRSRMNIDDIVEQDSSSSFIVMIVLAIALILGGWFLYSVSDISLGPSAGGTALTQPTNVPGVPHAS